MLVTLRGGLTRRGYVWALAGSPAQRLGQRLDPCNLDTPGSRGAREPAGRGTAPARLSKRIIVVPSTPLSPGRGSAGRRPLRANEDNSVASFRMGRSPGMSGLLLPGREAQAELARLRLGRDTGSSSDARMSRPGVPGGTAANSRNGPTGGGQQPRRASSSGRSFPLLPASRRIVSSSPNGSLAESGIDAAAVNRTGGCGET
jgi:hypothetical protein